MHIPNKLLVILSLSVVCVVNGAERQSSRPYRLPTKDSSALADQVCRARHNLSAERITAWIRKLKAPGSVHALVECSPTRTTPEYAVFYASECVRTTQWQCSPSDIRVRATFYGQPMVILTRGYNADLTYSLLSKIAAYRNQQGESVLSANTAQCSFASGPSKELLDIRCDREVFRLSYWCPQSTCPRIFSINNYFVPATDGGL